MRPAGQVRIPELDIEIFFRPVDNFQEKRFMHKCGQDRLHGHLSWCKFHLAQHSCAVRSPSGRLKKSILPSEDGPVKTVIFVVAVTAPVLVDKSRPCWADSFYS